MLLIEPLDYALAKMDELFFDKQNIKDKADIRASTRAMVRAYWFNYRDVFKEYLVTGVEKTLFAPIIDPGSKRDSGYIASGKLDVTLQELVRRKHKIIMDHKTLAFAFDESDIDHLKIAGQPMQYAMLGWANGIKFDSVIWDIIVKPQYRRRQGSSKVVTMAREQRVAQRKQVVDGIAYAKGEIVPARPEERENTPEESLVEFEERVLESMLADSARFFHRETSSIIPQNLLVHATELYEWTLVLDADRKSQRHLRNTDNCKKYNRPCFRMPLCLGSDDEDSGRWKKIGSHHAELELPQGIDPAKVITNSRMSLFKSCPTAHNSRYNDGLVRIDQDIDLSLYIGSAFHVGLEHLFKMVGNHQRAEGLDKL